MNTLQCLNLRVLSLSLTIGGGVLAVALPTEASTDLSRYKGKPLSCQPAPDPAQP
jgi:hypothetical protein